MEIKETKMASDRRGHKHTGKGKEALTYEQQLAFQHAQEVPVTEARAKKIGRRWRSSQPQREERNKGTGDNAEEHMTLRQILASERKTYTEEEVNKILELTKEK